MKAVVLAVALSGCWHFSNAEEPPPVESRGLSEARRTARGRADAGVADAAEGEGFGDQIGVQATGGSLGGRGGALGSGRPAPEWRRAPVDAGVPGAPVDAGVAGAPADAGAMVVPPGCVVARVIGRTMSFSPIEVVLTVAAGSNRGVASSWVPTIPNLPRASARILRVDRTITVVAARAMPDAFDVRQFVVLCP